MNDIGTFDIDSESEGPDIEELIHSGVPGASLWTKNEKYFWYHHSEADTMLVESSTYLDMNTAIFAAVSYVLADLSIDLPHHIEEH